MREKHVENQNGLGHEVYHLIELGRLFSDRIYENGNHSHYHYFIAKVACELILMNDTSELDMLLTRHDIERLATLNDAIREGHHIYSASESELEDMITRPDETEELLAEEDDLMNS